MITDNSNGRLAEINAFANENGLEESLVETFSADHIQPIHLIFCPFITLSPCIALNEKSYG